MLRTRHNLRRFFLYLFYNKRVLKTTKEVLNNPLKCVALRRDHKSKEILQNGVYLPTATLTNRPTPTRHGDAVCVAFRYAVVSNKTYLPSIYFPLQYSPSTFLEQSVALISCCCPQFIVVLPTCWIVNSKVSVLVLFDINPQYSVQY